MRVVSLLVALASLGCLPSSAELREGASIGDQSIGLARITLSPANAAEPLIFVTQRPLIGPDGSLKPDEGEPLVVSNLLPGPYHYVRMLTAQYGSVDLHGALPDFETHRGCISYIGDLFFDFSGPRPIVHAELHRKEALAEFQQRYPKMFATNPVCPEP